MKSIVLQTVFILMSSLTFAQVKKIDCMANGKALPIDNATVLKWKKTSANQFRARGHVQGTLIKTYPDYTGHHHYQVQIGTGKDEMIEIIYNEEFGIVPQASAGAKFEACGDYITSNKATPRGKPSPDGAIIHWVHRSNNLQAHDSGYIVVNGMMCGQQ
jgi:hypothetical protein